MINFSSVKNDKDCVCNVIFGTSQPSNNDIFLFRWSCNDSHYAYLLAQHFQNELDRRIKSAKEEAYNKGYMDGKSHNKKEIWFSSKF